MFYDRARPYGHAPPPQEYDVSKQRTCKRTPYGHMPQCASGAPSFRTALAELTASIPQHKQAAIAGRVGIPIISSHSTGNCAILAPRPVLTYKGDAMLWHLDAAPQGRGCVLHRLLVPSWR